VVVRNKPMKTLDEIDTTPTILKDETSVTFESIDLNPGDRAELVLCPMKAVRNSRLFMSSSNKDSTVNVEQVFHGRSAIFTQETLRFDSFRYGRKIPMTVSNSEPLKIIVINSSPLRTTVSASLASSEATSDTTYRLSGGQIAKDKE
jgi:hypothetical protein